VNRTAEATRTLSALAAAHKQRPVAELFLDTNRVADFSLYATGLLLDYSKQNLDRRARGALLALAETCDFSEARRRLLRGDLVNSTEQRPALHSLLRASTLPAEASADQRERFAEITVARGAMRKLCEQLRSGQVYGFSGEPVRYLINIGIGGSDLGPRLISEALSSSDQPVEVRYAANIDPGDLGQALHGLSAANTAFVVCSKSFSTEETQCNAAAAVRWLTDAGATVEQAMRQFFAVTSRADAAVAQGIPSEHCLPMWPWVGGRFSLWSPVGLSSAVAIGWEAFSQLLAGAEAMDDHFASAPPAQNMPLLLSLLEFWNCTVMGAQSYAVIPYSHALRALPAYLQQLTMESNGKSVSHDGSPLHGQTAPVLWGAAGSVGQHSFHQLLHQGTLNCPVDFILPLRAADGPDDRALRLAANCLAQSRALMLGRSLEQAEQALVERGLATEHAAQLAPHLASAGSRPNSILIMEKLEATELGALLALYEHRTFCSSLLWDINAFDQWGVELGKEIGAQLLERLRSDSAADQALDPSTAQLIKLYRAGTLKDSSSKRS
jgi:glucose-6-phosphate isomerase